MNRPPLDLTRLQSVRDQSASIAMGEWIASAYQDDLKTLITALETITTLCHSELAGRAWQMYPRTYRRGSLA